MDYENRVDFRAFDVMVHALDNATHDEILRAYQTAMDFRDMLSVRRTHRKIWGMFARMLSELEKEH